MKNILYAGLLLISSALLPLPSSATPYTATSGAFHWTSGEGKNAVGPLTSGSATVNENADIITVIAHYYVSTPGGPGDVVLTGMFSGNIDEYVQSDGFTTLHSTPLNVISFSAAFDSGVHNGVSFFNFHRPFDVALNQVGDNWMISGGFRGVGASNHIPGPLTFSLMFGGIPPVDLPPPVVNPPHVPPPGTPVPEPATLALLGPALMARALKRRFRS
ncbi:MAG: hypothetical protein U0136_21695 [Bdellovibrionota bacterium]